MDAENRDAQKTDVDRWLDSALRARMDAEPRMGLEDRVLARLADEPQRKAFAWWVPALAGMAAILVIALALVTSHSSSPKTTMLRGGPQPPSQEQVDSRNVQENATPSQELAPPRTRNRLRVARSTPDEGARRSVSVQRSARTAPVGKAQQESLPRLATFPASRPKTQQERLLAQLAAWNESHQDVSRSPDIASLKELSVTELEIDPLESTLAEETPKR